MNFSKVMGSTSSFGVKSVAPARFCRVLSHAWGLQTDPMTQQPAHITNNPTRFQPLFGGASFIRAAVQRGNDWRANTRIASMTVTKDNSVFESGAHHNKRIHPRRQTRSLVADIVTASGARLHGISQDVSAYGASFIITGNEVEVGGLSVGDRVQVHTSTARGLQAEINSIRPVADGDERRLVGLKLLDGQQWLSVSADDLSLLETVEEIAM